jgi:hypothetical protein
MKYQEWDAQSLDQKKISYEKMDSAQRKSIAARRALARKKDQNLPTIGEELGNTQPAPKKAPKVAAPKAIPQKKETFISAFSKAMNTLKTAGSIPGDLKDWAVSLFNKEVKGAGYCKIKKQDTEEKNTDICNTIQALGMEGKVIIEGVHQEPEEEPRDPKPFESLAGLQADKKFNAVLSSLFERWQDEKEYEEDINDYKIPPQKALDKHGCTITKMTKSPFGFTFEKEGKKFAYKVKAKGNQLDIILETR